MAHCTCINGHLMWNGDGKQIYLPYRLNFFKQFTDNNPSFILNSNQHNEIYDCYDISENEVEEYDCWYCDECKAITIFNYDSSIRYDFVITEDFNKSNISLSDYEKFAVINEKEFSKFQEYYKNMSPYYALTSFSFNQFAYVNKDKDLLLIKEIDKNQLFAYRLYEKQFY